MNASDPLSDLELNAYLDGELDPAERNSVEARLAMHPQDAERLAQLRRLNEQIQARYAPIAAEPLPHAMEAAVSSGAMGRGARPWLQMAAAIVLLLAGGTAGYVLRGITFTDTREKIAFVDDAVGAHMVYAVEVRHPVEVGASDESHLAQWLTKRIGADIHAPSLAERHFKLMGGRLLSAEGAPAAQFMYEDDRGRRLTLYIRRSADMENTAFQFAENKGLSAFTWVDRPLAYAIVAELPHEALLSVARLVYEQLD